MTIQSIPGATIEALDMRGRHNFPADDRGLVFVVEVARTPTTAAQTYAIRHRQTVLVDGWQVDRDGGWGGAVLWETGVRGTWDTAREARDALAAHLAG